jgi:hypothetical protein
MFHVFKVGLEVTYEIFTAPRAGTSARWASCLSHHTFARWHILRPLKPKSIFAKPFKEVNGHPCVQSQALTMYPANVLISNISQSSYHRHTTIQLHFTNRCPYSGTCHPAFGINPSTSNSMLSHTVRLDLSSQTERFDNIYLMFPRHLTPQSVTFNSSSQLPKPFVSPTYGPFPGLRETTSHGVVGLCLIALMIRQSMIAQWVD